MTSRTVQIYAFCFKFKTNWIYNFMSFGLKFLICVIWLEDLDNFDFYAMRFSEVFWTILNHVLGWFGQRRAKDYILIMNASHFYIILDFCAFLRLQTILVLGCFGWRRAGEDYISIVNASQFYIILDFGWLKSFAKKTPNTQRELPQQPQKATPKPPSVFNFLRVMMREPDVRRPKAGRNQKP